MGTKPFPRNQRCPCESGKKYKHCCYTKGFHYEIDDNTGEVVRSVPLDNEMRGLLQSALEQRRRALGRDLVDGDRLLDIDEAKVHEEMVATMRAAGIRPAMIYAYEKTGRLVTEANQNLLSDLELAEWDDAVAEYYALHPEDDPDLT